MNEPDYSGVELLEEAIRDAEAPPKTVYHYTTQNGLQGILAGKSIWASHVRYLNDLTEYSRGFDIAKDLISSDNCLKQHQGLLCAFSESAEQFKVFVASFSDDGGNRLSQWRGYCQGSVGFSIGIKACLFVIVESRATWERHY